MKRWLALVGLATLGFASQASAVGSLADVSVYDRNEGRELPVYFKDGKYFVVGRPGNRYQISVRNQAGEDLLAVTSVDGVNVVSGQTASFDQGGYVLNSYQRTDIKGWRKSTDHVAQFYFTELPDSYAARTGRPDDVGVIGVALFRRKQEPIAIDPDPYEYDRDESAPRSSAPSDGQQRYKSQGAPSAEAESRAPSFHRDDKKLGTGHGRNESSRARYVDFERASSSPDEVISIYYDSYRNLVAQGVIPHKQKRYHATPFPGQFVPDPPYYNN